MRTGGIKTWFHDHHGHMPNRHDLTLRAGHLVHDERFWAIFALAVLTALIVGFGIWAAVTKEPIEGPFPVTPFSPYLY